MTERDRVIWWDVSTLNPTSEFFGTHILPVFYPDCTDRPYTKQTPSQTPNLTSRKFSSLFSEREKDVLDGMFRWLPHIRSVLASISGKINDNYRNFDIFATFQRPNFPLTSHPVLTHYHPLLLLCRGLNFFLENEAPKGNEKQQKKKHNISKLG